MALSPEALRPPRDLDPNHVEPRVLTVYAGLLFVTFSIGVVAMSIPPSAHTTAGSRILI